MVNAERLAELFAEATERDAAGRGRFVVEIAAADPALAAELAAARRGGRCVTARPFALE